MCLGVAKKCIDRESNPGPYLLASFGKVRCYHYTINALPVVGQSGYMSRSHSHVFPRSRHKPKLFWGACQSGDIQTDTNSTVRVFSSSLPESNGLGGCHQCLADPCIRWDNAAAPATGGPDLQLNSLDPHDALAAPSSLGSGRMAEFDHGFVAEAEHNSPRNPCPYGLFFALDSDSYPRQSVRYTVKAIRVSRAS